PSPQTGGGFSTMQLEQMSCLSQSSGQLQLSSSNPQTPSPHREGHSTHKHLGPHSTGGISGVQIGTRGIALLTIFDSSIATHRWRLAPYRPYGIRPGNRPATKGIPGKAGGTVPTRNAGPLGLEEQEKIKIAISVDIDNLAPHRQSPIWPKPNAHRIHSGGIKRLGSQDGHWDFPLAVRIDAVWKSNRFDIDDD